MGEMGIADHGLEGEERDGWFDRSRCVRFFINGTYKGFEWARLGLKVVVLGLVIVKIPREVG